MKNLPFDLGHCTVVKDGGGNSARARVAIDTLDTKKV